MPGEGVIHRSKKENLRMRSQTVLQSILVLTGIALLAVLLLGNRPLSREVHAGEDLVGTQPSILDSVDASDWTATGFEERTIALYESASPSVVSVTGVKVPKIAS